MKRGLIWLAVSVGVIGLTAVHFFVAALPPTQATPLILLDHIWRLGLLLGLLWLATPIGLAVATRLQVRFAAPVEALPFTLALGLGTIMTALTWLGLIHLFNLIAVLVVLGGITWLTRAEWSPAGALWRGLALAIMQTLRRPGQLSFLKIALVMVGLVLLTAALPTLAPIDSYDALMYHLPAPQAFIAAGQIVPFPQQVQPNYPLGFEMLYALGLMLQADRLAQMLHFATVALLALAIYAFARRFLNRLAGLLAVLILLASPKITLIAGWAFTDMAFVFFATLAVYAVAVWWQDDSPGWLLMAGLLAGLMLSLKYYGARPALALGLALCWHEVRAARGWPRLVRDALMFGGAAFIVAAPWYIKNWLWLGNPIYPFFWGGVNWDIFRAEEWARWVNTFGRGHSLTAYLALPVNIWLYPADFSATPQGYFNPGLLLALLAWWLRPPRVLVGLWVYIIAQFYLWAMMMQELRYLLLILPWLSLAAGWALARLFEMSRVYRWRGALVRTAPFVLLAFTLAIHLAMLTPFGKNTLLTVFGLESAANYLRRANYIYPATEVINTQLPAAAYVVFLGEGQTYYCQRACLADPIYDRWGDLVYRYQTVERILSRLQMLGATHILINRDSLQPARRNQDPADPRAEHSAVFELFRQKYLTLLYTDRLVDLYQINAERLQP